VWPFDCTGAAACDKKTKINRKKGDTINTSTALEKPFNKKLDLTDPSRTWDTTLLISHNSRSTLPRSLKQAGAHKLYILKTSLADASLSEVCLTFS
jgi:hypothetical protein